MSGDIARFTIKSTDPNDAPEDEILQNASVLDHIVNTSTYVLRVCVCESLMSFVQYTSTAYSNSVQVFSLCPRRRLWLAVPELQYLTWIQFHVTYFMVGQIP